jgi:VanZ family protein
MNRRLLISLAFYAGLIVYGSLYPFAGWRFPAPEAVTVLKGGWPAHISRSDLVTNLLVYAPLGYLLFKNMRPGMGKLSGSIVATVMGTLLSFVMEFLQMFIPGRDSSLSDVVLNGTSTLGGVLIALNLEGRAGIGQRLISLRSRWFLSGKIADVGLAVMGLWALSQLSPFIPSLDWGGLKSGLKPLWHTLHDPGSFNLYQAAVYVLKIGGLAGIAVLLMIDGSRIAGIFACFVAAVLLCKIAVAGRQLSLEAISGLFAGFVMLLLLRRVPLRVVPFAAGVLILAAFVIDELRPAVDSNAVSHQFNWVPFRGQMAKESGFTSILEGLWPFTALAYLSLVMFPQHRCATAIFGGGLLILVVTALELMQQFIPGRYPDITQAILAAVGWALPLMV